MHKTALSLLAISLLAGCVSTGNEQQNKKTLNAIKESESVIAEKLELLELGLSNQTDYIDSLESEVIILRSQVDEIRTEKVRPVYISSGQPRADIPSSENTNTGSTNSSLSLRQPIVLGGLENIHIDAIQQTFTARIDTGATTSSIHAADIEKFEREGKQWVRFHLAKPSIDNKKKEWIEAPVVRYASIRQSTSDSVEKRAVVELWVKIGKIHEKSQFTLADRSQMSHPLLLGREFIRDIALVDVSENYLLSKPQKTYKKNEG